MGAMAITAVLGEWLCLRRELQDIPLSEHLLRASPLPTFCIYELEAQRGSSASCLSRQTHAPWRGKPFMADTARDSLACRQHNAAVLRQCRGVGQDALICGHIDRRPFWAGLQHPGAGRCAASQQPQHHAQAHPRGPSLELRHGRRGQVAVGALANLILVSILSLLQDRVASSLCCSLPQLQISSSCRAQAIAAGHFWDELNGSASPPTLVDRLQS